MNPEIRALLIKEWVKSRKAILVILSLLAYAVIDTWLTLRGINQIHGSFGAAATILLKQPQFFSAYQALFVAGMVLAFAQFWPESQGKRLRILFHMPIRPEIIIATTLVCGITVLMGINLFALAGVAASMAAVNIPIQLIQTIIITLLSWSLLSIACYLTVATFLSSNSLLIRLMAISCGAFCYETMGIKSDYLVNSSSYDQYLLVLIGLAALVVFSLLDFKSDANPSRSYRYSRHTALLLVMVALSQQLPSLYQRSTGQSVATQRISYSLTRDEFLVTHIKPEQAVNADYSNLVSYRDSKDNALGWEEYQAALPLTYARTLEKWGQWPGEIQGIALTPYEAQAGRDYQRIDPETWFKPEPALQMVIESNPKEAGFQLPVDFMRLMDDRHRLEFITPRTGKINVEKSQAFTQALTDAGITYPIVHLSNNINVMMKTYDNGFIISDADNRLFQLKMVDGKPQAKNLNIQLPEPIEGVLVSEDQLRRTLAFVATENAIYVVTANQGQLVQLPADNYRAAHTDLFIKLDLFGISLTTTQFDAPFEQRQVVGVRVNNEYEEINRFQTPKYPDAEAIYTPINQLQAVLFPIIVVQQQYQASWLNLRLEVTDYLTISAVANALCVGLMLFLWRRKGTTISPIHLLLVAVFGIFALILCYLVNHRHTIKGIRL